MDAARGVVVDGQKYMKQRDLRQGMMALTRLRYHGAMKWLGSVRVLLVSVVIVSAPAVSGCRQPDGPMPQPNGEQENKIVDLGRDLQNVSRGDATAVGELRDDLGGLSSVVVPTDRVGALSSALANALRGKMLADDMSARLARPLFIALAADGLSERQVEALRQDLKAMLTEAQVASPEAQAVADAVRDVQQDIGTNEKRWWHRG